MVPTATSVTPACAPLHIARPGVRAPPLIGRVGGRASPERVARLRQKLLEWLEECDDLEGGAEGQAFGGLIAFYARPPEGERS